MKKLLFGKASEKFWLYDAEGNVDVEYGLEGVIIDAEWANCKQQWTFEQFSKIVDSFVEIRDYLITNDIRFPTDSKRTSEGKSVSVNNN